MKELNEECGANSIQIPSKIDHHSGLLGDRTGYRHASRRRHDSLLQVALRWSMKCWQATRLQVRTEDSNRPADNVRGEGISVDNDDNNERVTSLYISEACVGVPSHATALQGVYFDMILVDWTKHVESSASASLFLPRLCRCLPFVIPEKSLEIQTESRPRCDECLQHRLHT